MPVMQTSRSGCFPLSIEGLGAVVEGKGGGGGGVFLGGLNEKRPSHTLKKYSHTRSTLSYTCITPILRAVLRLRVQGGGQRLEGVFGGSRGQKAGGA